MRVGIAGIGKMGAAIAARLKDTGTDVVVWNRSRAKAEATGLPMVDTPRALAEQSDAVVSILFDAAAVQAAYQGEDGLLAAARFARMSRRRWRRASGRRAGRSSSARSAVRRGRRAPASCSGW
nr:NAD(P)-binding domain-containing protein [Paraburkholderia heleia]